MDWGRDVVIPPFVPPPAQTCRICKEPTKQRCSRCKRVYYCSPEHAKKGWRTHKQTCVSGEHKIVQGILLPVDEDLPREIDVVCTVKPPEDGDKGYDSMDVEEYMGDNFKQYLPVGTTEGLKGSPLKDHLLIFIIREAGLLDGSPLNQCVQHITGGKAWHRWCGPIVVMREIFHGQAIWQRTERYEDLKMEDFMGPGVKYLTLYGTQ